MILEGKILRHLAEGPILPTGEQLGMKVGEVVKQFRTLDQLLLPYEGKLVRLTIEEIQKDANPTG
jgi:hypothetical protein